MSERGDEARWSRSSGWARTPPAVWLPSVALVAIVGAGAVVRPLAPFVFVALLFMYLVARRFRYPSGALAALLPAAAIIAWRSLPHPEGAAGAVQCADPLSPPAIWRLLLALLALGVTVALAVAQRERLAELGLRRPAREIAVLSVAGFAVVAPLALYIAVVGGGESLGGLFFGTFAFDLGQPLAIVPALVFALSNALGEELAYRGAMRVWLAPSLGVLGANVAQAVLFGLAHTGDDFQGAEFAITTAVGAAVVGLVAGVIARRTRSLALLIAIHAAADVPIYLYYACRIA